MKKSRKRKSAKHVKKVTLQDIFDAIEKSVKIAIKTSKFLVKMPKKVMKMFSLIEEKTGRGSLYIGILIMLMFSAVILVQKDFDARVVSVGDAESKKEIDDVSITRFHTHYFTNSKNNWSIEAQTAKVFEMKDEVELFAVYLEHYTKKGVGATVKANRAIMKNKTKDIYLYGNVIIKNKKGTTLSGESFFYNNKMEMITSKELVTIDDPKGSKISGKGFSSTKNLENITFDSSVQGAITSKK